MAVRVLGLIVVLALAACARDEPRLMNAASNSVKDGPDEFAITTNRPLEEPASYAALPAPTTGGSNLADVDPRADAIAALGGRAPVAGRTARPSPLLAYASRFGYDPAIRQRLAAEDLEYRRRNRGKPLERLFGLNLYFEAYEAMSLDQSAELERLRSFGILTPAAPPEPF